MSNHESGTKQYGGDTTYGSSTSRIHAAMVAERDAR